MTDNAELKRIRNRALRQMYNEAEPGLDFDDLLENPEKYPDNWHQRHHLPSERVKEIFENHVDGHDLTTEEHAQLTLTVITDLSPTSQPVDTG